MYTSRSTKNTGGLSLTAWIGQQIGEGLSSEYDPRKGIEFTPNEGPQTVAYESDADEVLFGGAAGGGKSALLIGKGSTKHKKALILRREKSQIADLRDKSKLFVGDAGSYNGSEHRWGFKNGHLQFGGIPHEKDIAKYQGQENDFLGFDELAHFTPKIYRTMRTWVRSTDPNQQKQVLSTSNPPLNAEERWIIAEFEPWVSKRWKGKRPEDGGLLFYVYNDNDTISWYESKAEIPEGAGIRSRTFIRSFVWNNPYLMQDEDYLNNLKSLPPVLRKIMLQGEFDVEVDDDDFQVFPSAWVRAAMDRYAVLEAAGAINRLPPIPTQLGVDAARGGKDNMVVARRFHNIIAPLVVIKGRDVPRGQDGAARVLKSCGNSFNVRVVIDEGGAGASPSDFLTVLMKDVVLFNFAGSADGMTDNTGRFPMLNRRAAAYFSLRYMLDPLSGQNTALPNDEKLYEEMINTRFEIMQTGKIKIEEKKKIKERIGRSPDRADATVLAFWNSVGVKKAAGWGKVGGVYVPT